MLSGLTIGGRWLLSGLWIAIGVCQVEFLFRCYLTNCVNAGEKRRLCKFQALVFQLLPNSCKFFSGMIPECFSGERVGVVELL